MVEARRRAKLRLGRLIDTMHESMRTWPAQEQTYRYLFLRDIGRADVADEFYPVGSAANYSLLYLLVRSLRELPVSRIVEFGAGQSTILIDRLVRHGTARVEVTTVEQDAWWAQTIGTAVRHRVVHAPLAPTSVGGRSVMFYDPEGCAALDTPDFALIDGPVAHTATHRYDRLGAVEFLRQRLGDEFTVIFDDCERAGEAEAARQFRAWLDGRGAPYFENTVRAAKQQKVFCTPKFRAAAHF